MWRQRRSSKYGNKTTLHNGVQYHSKKEAAYAESLDLLVKAGEIESWERQVRISLDVGDYHICNYYVDFLIHHKDGIREFVEIKGFETDVWRLKWKLFEALWGDKKDIRLTVIK